MEAEQERRLTQRLQEGVVVKELFPHSFFEGFVYYDISIHEQKISLVVEAKRKSTTQRAEPLIMQITKIFKIVRGEKERITESKLISRKVFLAPPKHQIKNERQGHLSLTGTIFLQ